MTLVGRVESLWRYPVKSMRGEELDQAFIGFAGVYGDRLYAFRSAAARSGFPWVTAREQARMLLCQPLYRHPDKMREPLNLAEAEALAPGATPVYADSSERALEVGLPDGRRYPIEDPELLRELGDGLRDQSQLSLVRSERSLADCRPVSLFSIQTVRQLSEELQVDLDKRRFRANLYLDLSSAAGFGEDQFVGHTLRIGQKACVAVTDRDPRCKMITLDPETGTPNPDVIKQLSRSHEGKAGVYGAVVVEGTIRPGDEILLLP